MPDLMIYHPGTGTVIPLSDEVYLVNPEFTDEIVIDDMLSGVGVPPWHHKGYRIDNTNMGRLFYGSNG
jgi:hypothetical protein